MNWTGSTPLTLDLRDLCSKSRLLSLQFFNLVGVLFGLHLPKGVARFQGVAPDQPRCQTGARRPSNTARHQQRCFADRQCINPGSGRANCNLFVKCQALNSRPGPGVRSQRTAIRQPDLDRARHKREVDGLDQPVNRIFNLPPSRGAWGTADAVTRHPTLRHFVL